MDISDLINFTTMQLTDELIRRINVNPELLVAAVRSGADGPQDINALRITEAMPTGVLLLVHGSPKFDEKTNSWVLPPLVAAVGSSDAIDFAVELAIARLNHARLESAANAPSEAEAEALRNLEAKNEGNPS